MKLKSGKNLNARGFTLVEVLAAVMILSIGLIGSLKLIGYNLHNISFSEDRIIASGLVEDGLERLRNARDTNWLKETANWSDGIEGTGQERYIKIFCGNNAITDMSNPDPSGSTERALIDDCVVDGNCKIYAYANGPIKCYGNDFGASYPPLNSYTRGNFNNFYRLVHLEKINNDSISVAVTVRWSEGAQNKYLTAEEVLYNWQ